MREGRSRWGAIVALAPFCVFVKAQIKSRVLHGSDRVGGCLLACSVWRRIDIPTRSFGAGLICWVAAAAAMHEMR
jgi:hypothetical protein